jgi:GAF domain-containing protein
MKQRSKARGKAGKSGRHKAAALKRGHTPPKTMPGRRSAMTPHETDIARLSRERDEALEQQAATADVLKVISRSTFDLQPVLDTVCETAARLCDAEMAFMLRRDGEVYRAAADFGFSPTYRNWLQSHPITPNRGSITGRVALERRAVQIVDVASDPEYTLTEATSLGGVHTQVGVPLLREGEPIGVICLARQRTKPFTDRQIELVTSFAAQAVIAIENARLLTELRQRTDDLTEALEQQTATADVLQVISSSPGDLQPVFASMLENAARICEAQSGNIYRWDGKALHLEAAHNAPAAFVDARKRVPFAPPPTGPFGRMIATKTATHVADLAAEEDYVRHRKPDIAKAVESGGVRTFLAVPMVKDDRLIGAFSLFRQAVRPFTEKQIDLVKSFAAQAVIAIENARLLTELRESLEQQTATADVLRVISSSPGDLEPVFGALLEKAVRLCGAKFGNLHLREGAASRTVAMHNAPAAYVEARLHTLIQPGPHTALAQAMRTKRAVQVEDVKAGPAYRARDPLVVSAVELGGVRTMLVVPMLKDGELVGSINIYRQDVMPFNQKQIDIVSNFAAQAVIAVENARLLNELRQRTDELGRSVGELRALGEVSQAVNSTLELETVLDTIVAKAVQLSSTDAGAIYVFNDQQREFRLRATYGMDRELIEALTQRHIGVDEPNISPAFLAGEPIQVPDLREAVSSAANDIVLRAGFRALLIAPLLRGGDIAGMLVVRRRTPGAFVQNTVDLIKTFAAQSAVAIENARLFKNVEASLEDLRNTQDRLVQTQKLAALGQLTAGIAHEIKNPLNFVNNFSGVSAELLDELQESFGKVKADANTIAEISELTNTLRDNLQKIVQHGRRADSIVRNMLLHSREGSGEHRSVDINTLVDEAVNLAYHGARAERKGFNITLERSFDPAAGRADCFPQEITRVLLNLIANGFYAASQRKGQVIDDHFEPKLTAATKNLGDQIEISIRDNGTGISPEVKEKLFNPFFTTKPTGEGTGLGLSISHDIIVKQHGGSIEVDTQPGEFTEFRIVLPRAAAGANKSGGRHEPAHSRR